MGQWKEQFYQTIYSFQRSREMFEQIICSFDKYTGDFVLQDDATAASSYWNERF